MVDKVYINTGTTISQPYIARYPANARQPSIATGQTPYPYIANARQPVIASAQQPYPYIANAQAPYIASAQQPYPYIANSQTPYIASAQQPYPYIANAQAPYIAQARQPSIGTAQGQTPYPYIANARQPYTYQNPFTTQQPYTYHQRNPFNYHLRTPVIAQGTTPAIGTTTTPAIGTTTQSRSISVLQGGTNSTVVGTYGNQYGYFYTNTSYSFPNGFDRCDIYYRLVWSNSNRTLTISSSAPTSGAQPNSGSRHRTDSSSTVGWNSTWYPFYQITMPSTNDLPTGYAIDHIFRGIAKSFPLNPGTNTFVSEGNGNQTYSMDCDGTIYTWAPGANVGFHHEYYVEGECNDVSAEDLISSFRVSVKDTSGSITYPENELEAPNGYVHPTQSATDSFNLGADMYLTYTGQTQFC